MDACDQCGARTISYNSCRNRHCPKCQSLEKQRWLEQRCGELLPVPYFHVVFTVPEELNSLALATPEWFYSLLFDSASKTLLAIAADPKHLGARIGVLAVLHTWSQTLLLHPHVNSRLVRLEGDQVTFTYKDYAQGARVREMRLRAGEFIRRFLLHVLPERFVRIRYYGLFANRHRASHLEQCRELLGQPAAETQAWAQEDWQARWIRLTGRDPTLCPVCGQGHLRRVEELAPVPSGLLGRSPP